MVMTAVEIRACQKKPGMHSDGAGLYLRVQKDGGAAWIFRYQMLGRRREMGLGSLADVPAPRARQLLAELRGQVITGIDPIDARDGARKEEEARLMAIRKALTFDEVVREYLEAHRDGWSNAKHAQQWENTLAKYASPVIGNKQVRLVTREDVHHILKPIWTAKPETASRMRSRLELVLDYAKAHDMRQGENPAIWRGNLEAVLPPIDRIRKVQHHPALPYRRMAEFLTDLRGVNGYGAQAVHFGILTASRSGEIRQATWSEINLKDKIWTVPPEHMKARREHRVPLAQAVISLLRNLPRLEDSEHVFPGVQGKVMSDMTLNGVIRRMNQGKPEEKPSWNDAAGRQIVMHGFRSSFRDWAAEETAFPSEMAELALAHTVGSAVERAYRRSDLFERRREMMEAWAKWCGMEE